MVVATLSIRRKDEETDCFGALVPVKGPRALSDAFAEALKDEGPARGTGIRGRARMSADFTVERHVRNLENVILKTIASA